MHELSPIAHPKFSKMSGIQEWKNCVVLYVNVGDKYGNSYDNVFTNCGGCITWFAQPRQDEESSPIKTILSTMSKKEVSCEETKEQSFGGGRRSGKSVSEMARAFVLPNGRRDVHILWTIESVELRSEQATDEVHFSVVRRSTVARFSRLSISGRTRGW